MANGNTGDYLGDYWDDSNLYVSDNAGVTWTKALDGPYKYEFGDQGSVLPLAIRDTKKYDSGEIRYSLDHGQSWKTEALPDKLTVKPIFLTTVRDSTGLKFVLAGEREKDGPIALVSIDFEGLHEATCKDSDLRGLVGQSRRQGRSDLSDGPQAEIPSPEEGRRVLLEEGIQ